MVRLTSEDLADLRRWMLSGATVLTVAGGVAAAALAPGAGEDVQPAEPSGAIGVVFEEEAVAPAREVNDLPPGPEQVATEAVPASVAEAKPEEKLPPIPDLPPVPDAEVALPREVKPETAPTRQAQAAVETNSAPQVAAERTASVAAAPTEAAPDPLESKAVATWRTQLLAVVEKNKRYPEAARARRERGVVVVAFQLDREGRVVGAQVARGSGSATLDDEAIALLRRVEPFPIPPSILPGERISVNLPIRFAAR